MAVSMDQVKELRERSGAGILECKKILEQTGGDMTKALAILREKGMQLLDKKADRVAADGLIEVYVHHTGKVAALIELNCETDFVARTDAFKQLAKDIALQVASINPRWLRVEDVPEGEREKPDAPENFDEEYVLLASPFVKNPSVTIGEKIREAAGKLGENIVLRRFVRYEVGVAG